MLTLMKEFTLTLFKFEQLLKSGQKYVHVCIIFLKISFCMSIGTSKWTGFTAIFVLQKQRQNMQFPAVAISAVKNALHPVRSI